MKRGKRLSVSLEEQKSVFIQYQAHFKTESELPSSCSVVYKELSKTLCSRMSAYALFFSAKRNFKYFFGTGNVNEEKNQKKQISIQDYSSRSSSSDHSSIDDRSSDSSNFSNDNDKDLVSFEINLEEWEHIKPQSYCYARNGKNRSSVKYRNMKRMPINKWTDYIREYIWRYTTNRCTWILKNNTASDNYTVKFTGHCKQCEGKLSVSTEKKDSVVIAYCSIMNVNPRLQHDPIKVRLTNYNKQKFASELEHQYPVVVRNKLVRSKLTDDDTIEPPFVPSLKTLQNVRNRTNTSKYYHKIVVLALWVMSCTPPFNTVIRNVSLHPFFAKKFIAGAFDTIFTCY